MLRLLLSQSLWYLLFSELFSVCCLTFFSNLLCRVGEGMCWGGNPFSSSLEEEREPWERGWGHSGIGP